MENMLLYWQSRNFKKSIRRREVFDLWKTFEQAVLPLTIFTRQSGSSAWAATRERRIVPQTRNPNASGWKIISQALRKIEQQLCGKHGSL